MRDKDGSYRNEDEESDGDWWITDGVYYHIEDGLVYRYKFSRKDPATHQQLGMTNVISRTKLTEKKE